MSGVPGTLGVYDSPKEIGKKMTKPFLTRPGDAEELDDFVLRVMTNLLGPDHGAVTSTKERMAARREAAAAEAAAEAGTSGPQAAGATGSAADTVEDADDL